MAAKSFLSRFETSGLVPRLAQWYRRTCGLHKYGLNYDDIRAETKVVNEALRRLPHKELEARDRRLKMAFDLTMKKNVLLPQDQAVAKKFVDPVYLKPYLDEVVAEKAEREAFRQ